MVGIQSVDLVETGFVLNVDRMVVVDTRRDVLAVVMVVCGCGDGSLRR